MPSSIFTSAGRLLLVFGLMKLPRCELRFRIPTLRLQHHVHIHAVFLCSARKRYSALTFLCSLTSMVGITVSDLSLVELFNLCGFSNVLSSPFRPLMLFVSILSLDPISQVFVFLASKPHNGRDVLSGRWIRRSARISSPLSDAAAHELRSK
jgi:hypothetical protein